MNKKILKKLSLACATALYMFPLSAMDEPMEPRETQPRRKRVAEGYLEGNSHKRPKLSDETKDVDASPIAENQSVPADVYGYTAAAYSKAGNFAKAAEYYEQYVAALNAVKQSVPTVVYGRAATSHYNAGNFAKAAEYYEQYIAKLKAMGQPVHDIFYECTAQSHFKAENFAKAAEYCEQQIAALNAAGQPVLAPVLAHAYNNAALSYAKLGGHDEQVIHYGELWHGKKKGAYTNYEIELLEHMIDAYTHQGNHKRAAFFANILENIQG